MLPKVIQRDTKAVQDRSDNAARLRVLAVLVHVDVETLLTVVLGPHVVRRAVHPVRGLCGYSIEGGSDLLKTENAQRESLPSELVLPPREWGEFPLFRSHCQYGTPDPT